MNGRRGACATAAAAAAALLLVAAVWSPSPAWPDGAIEVNLETIGHTDLGGRGPWDDVAVVGTTAVVSTAGSACGPSAEVAVVDLKDPHHPRVASTVAVPAGRAVVAVDVRHLATPTFTGDLAALAVRACPAGGAGGGFLYYDVGDPAAPRLLARADGLAPQSVSIGVRSDGRAVLAAVVDSRGPGGPVVELDDVSDPGRPVLLTRWVPPAGDPPPCPVTTGDVELAEGAGRAVVVFDDGAVYDLDLADPAHPVVRSTAPAPLGGGRSPYVTSLPVGRRTLAVVSEGHSPDAACAGGVVDRGLRLLAVDPPAALTEQPPVGYPSPAAPGRLAASGELAFVAWHGDGLRILDLGLVTPRTTAQFVPPTTAGAAPDVVGVAVTRDELVVVDAGSGLYVLDRPAEGHVDSFWSKLKYAVRFMSIPVFFGAVWVVPRLALRGVPATSRSRVPVPAGRQRRR